MPKRTLNVKKSTYRRRRRMYRRKRRSTAQKIGRSMQNKSLSYIRKKYTAVTPIRMGAGTNEISLTISHIGGCNTNVTDPNLTVVLANCNPDGLLDTDMKSYQFFRITGVSYKLFWPEGTDLDNTPV